MLDQKDVDELKHQINYMMIKAKEVPNLERLKRLRSMAGFMEVES